MGGAASTLFAMVLKQGEFERALDVDNTASPLWLKYAAFEIRNKNINRARNIYDRAVTLLPRVDQLW